MGRYHHVDPSATGGQLVVSWQAMGWVHTWVPSLSPCLLYSGSSSSLALASLLLAFVVVVVVVFCSWAVTWRAPTTCRARALVIFVVVSVMGSWSWGHRRSRPGWAVMWRTSRYLSWVVSTLLLVDRLICVRV